MKFKIFDRFHRIFYFLVITPSIPSIYCWSLVDSAWDIYSLCVSYISIYMDNNSRLFLVVQASGSFKGQCHEIFDLFLAVFSSFAQNRSF